MRARARTPCCNNYERVIVYRLLYEYPPLAFSNTSFPTAAFTDIIIFVGHTIRTFAVRDIDSSSQFVLFFSIVLCTKLLAFTPLRSSVNTNYNLEYKFYIGCGISTLVKLVKENFLSSVDLASSDDTKGSFIIRGFERNIKRFL